MAKEGYALKNNVGYNIVSDMFGPFKGTFQSNMRQLVQFDMVAKRFMQEYDLEGKVHKSVQYISDIDSTPYISELAFQKPDDKRLFLDYIGTYLAVSLGLEHEDSLHGLEENVLKLQKQMGAVGPYTAERRNDGSFAVPPMLVKVPEGYNNEEYANRIEIDMKRELPGIDIILSYTKDENKRY